MKNNIAVEILADANIHDENAADATTDRIPVQRSLQLYHAQPANTAELKKVVDTTTDYIAVEILVDANIHDENVYVTTDRIAV